MHRSAHLPELVDGDLRLREAEPGDAPVFWEMVSEPEAAIYWQATSEEEIATELEEAGGWAIELDGETVGWLQAHEEDYWQFPSVAFDITVMEAARRRGIARRALRLAISHFIAEGHHRFTIDPAVGNEAAIRCYSAVGFKAIGIARQQEVLADGTRRDGLLMDLLAEEFRGTTQAA